MNARTKLTYNHQYSWSMTVAVGSTAMDDWGTYKARRPGETIAEAQQAILEACAKRLRADPRLVRVVVFKFAE